MIKKMAEWMPKWASSLDGEISVHWRLDVVPRITVVRPGSTDILDTVPMPEFMWNWHPRDIQRFTDAMNHRIQPSHTR